MRRRYLFILLIFLPYQAYADCAPGYEQQERAAIKAHYQEQITQVNQRRDEKIRAALEQYKQEYYPQAKITLEEFQKERAALAERIREEEPGAGKQQQYNQEVREIGKDYRKEISVLRKDQSGKYWAEINTARTEARELRQEIYAMKEEEIVQFREHIAQNCKDQRTPLRKTFEGTSDAIDNGKPPAENKPSGGLDPGIRG